MAQEKKQATSISLGNSDIRVSPVGVGAWAWGARSYWGNYSASDLRAAFEATLAGGITFLDTAEIYGMGRSELFVGEFMRGSSPSPVIATKFFPYPWRVAKGQLIGALKASLRRLGIDKVDLYQIHQPLPPMPIDTWVSALADAVERGLTRLVGVSNYGVAQTQRTFDILQARGVHLASNQVHYSLLDRQPEKSGLLDLCKRLNVTLIAYTPLEQGVLAGKYTPANPPTGVRARRYSLEYLADVQPVVDLLRQIGLGHGGKTPGQVAINWTVAKGTLPIPGARDQRQAQEIVGTLGWSLTPDEVSALDQASDKVSQNPTRGILEGVIHKE
jgi:aryl-alcohol dehydrogenase-like predicted oxidoreductase